MSRRVTLELLWLMTAVSTLAQRRPVLTQIDLPSGQRSGLNDALEIVREIPGVGIITFSDADVVRHPLVARIVRAYDQRDRARSRPIPLPVPSTPGHPVPVPVSP